MSRPAPHEAAPMQGHAEIHLYHCAGTRSERVKLLLDRLGLAYRLTHVDQAAGAHRAPDYLSVNPFGTLPGMTIGGRPVVESAAQMIVIADLDPLHRLAPAPDDPARPDYIQWLVAAPVSLEPMVLPAFGRFPRPGARKGVRTALALQTRLFRGPYCASDRLTAADIFLHWGLRQALKMGLLEADMLWTEYTERLEAELDWPRAAATSPS